MEKPKPNKPKGPSGPPQKSQAGKPASTPPAPVAPVKVAPLFRRIDWLVFIVSFAAIWIAYLFTLAPDLTLEDSGELCTASFYAGIPHPPGYPFWSIYSYFWTLLPWGSVTWRVEVGESFAAAIACGLVGLMVSRGSSMLIEGIKELNDTIDRKWEAAICIVCGITAGLLLGFDDFMWKESVVINRISVFDVPWLMLVAACLMRWIYAPQQRRYLYVAMFFFGLCFTIHQTMLVAAMGIEMVVIMAHQRYGRSFCFWNSIIYLAVLLFSQSGNFSAFTSLDNVFKGIFHVVGILSLVGYVFLIIYTKENSTELARDGALAGAILFLCLHSTLGSLGLLLSFVSLIAFFYLTYLTWRRDLGWLVAIACGFLWALGAAFFFYEPVSGMTVPPMQWGYPRTVEGFFHAFTRGQYESAHPTNVFLESGHFVQQLGLLVNGLANSYSWVFLFVALLPFLFIFKMQKRERGWIIGLASVYLCVGILLTIVMNTTPDRQSAEENKVFFTASHGIVAIMIGYGLALMSAYMATHYKNFRPMALTIGAVTIIPAMTLLFDSVSMTFYGGAGLLEYVKVLVLFLTMAVAFVMAALAAQSFLKIKGNPATATPDDRFYMQMFGGVALAFLIFSIGLAFFARNSHFGIAQVFDALPRIFAPHQYSSPVIGALILLLAVFAFIGSVFAYKNRAPLAITLALFTLTPLYSGLSHWAKGEERNHWFGFWFGHDMFTPPFAGPDGKFSYDPKLREQMLKDPVKGKLTYPEMDRNTILFGGTDPGRFNPTYMIFCESFVPASCKPMDPNFDRRDVYLITQNALADGTYLDYLRSQYYRSAQIDPPFFSRFFRFVACTAGMGNRNNVVMNVNDPDCGKGNSGSSIVEGLSGLLDKSFDQPLTKFGAKVEAKRRAEGVYPPAEIYIPSPEDSEKAFKDYTDDVYRRQQLGRLQPGEDVHVDDSGRVSVTGQVAVMMINGLLCKVIFDKNPTNEFYVEESFPLEWMYPYETPYGIIMKINRQPLAALPEDVLERDHEFWRKYCERTIGTNVVTDTTSVGEICTNFIQKVYLNHDYSNFKGDLKFLRDDDAQKAFSKLRDSQAGMYAWRLRLLLPTEMTHVSDEYMIYRPKSDTEVQQLVKEADYAFKQSFAFCPYSPETVVRYVNFLYQFNRFDDALLVAQTCKKLDPYNTQMDDIINQVMEIKKQYGARDKLLGDVQQMEVKARQHPEDVQNLLTLGSAYFEMQDTQRATETLNKALTNSAINYNQIAGLAQFYSRIGDMDKLETALKKLAVIDPNQPEAHYDLAAIEVVRGETNASIDELKTAMNLNARRLKADPNARDLAATNRMDARFDSIRDLPEFQKIVSPK